MKTEQRAWIQVNKFQPASSILAVWDRCLVESTEPMEMYERSTAAAVLRANHDLNRGESSRRSWTRDRTRTLHAREWSSGDVSAHLYYSYSGVKRGLCDVPHYP